MESSVESLEQIKLFVNFDETPSLLSARGPDMGGYSQIQMEAVSSAHSGTRFQVILDSRSLEVCNTERFFKDVTDYDR